MINLPPPENWKQNSRNKGVSRRTTKEEREQIAKFIANNSCNAAEMEFGISNTLAKKCRDEFGVPKKSKGRQKIYTADDVAALVAYRKAGHPPAQTASNFGISKSSIKRLTKGLIK